MSLANLLSAIEEDAGHELEHARLAAADRVERIRVEAGERAESLRREVLATADKEAASEGAIVMSRARSAAAARYSEARESALTELRLAAEMELLHYRGIPGYADALAHLLGEALRVVGTARTVQVDPRDEVAIAELLGPDSPAEVVADLTTAGGVVVTGPGRVIDNTLEKRLEAAWPELRGAVCLGWEPAGDEIFDGRTR
ncbi:MAG: V-type ATP synthase subunit E [Nocardioides sp.]